MAANLAVQPGAATYGSGFTDANGQPYQTLGGMAGAAQGGSQDPRDPAYVRQKVTAALTRRAQAYGRPAPTEADIAEGVNYVLTPDTYSDGNVRSGWSDYWD